MGGLGGVTTIQIPRSLDPPMLGMTKHEGGQTLVFPSGRMPTLRQVPEGWRGNLLVATVDDGQSNTCTWPLEIATVIDASAHDGDCASS